MTTLTREQANRQAVKGASERLTRLEKWMRQLFYIAIATCAMVEITFMISLYGAWKYWQVTSAMSSYTEHSRAVLNDPEVKASQARADAARAKLQKMLDDR